MDAINENGGKYAGLYINQARTAIVQDLTAAGLLEKTEKIQQEVGVCDRCKAQVEILERKQWFMKTLPLSEAVEKNANEILWYPDYMKNRLIDWTQSLDWDWVVSRQRLFATPIPVWYCKNCGEVIVAHENWVPIDPRMERPTNRQMPQMLGKRISWLKQMFWTLGWTRQSPAPSTLVGLTEQIGNICSQQASTLQALTSSEHGHTTSWCVT